MNSSYAPLSSLDVEPDNEKQPAGLAIYPSLPTPTPRTLIDILEASTLSHPQARAIEDGTTRLTYQQLSHSITARAEQLYAFGIGAGDRVGIRIRSGSAELYVSILAVLSVGAAYVPVDVDDPDDRAQLIWSEAGVSAVLTDFNNITRTTLHTNNTRRRPGLEDDAWIIFTSGSTGKPKGVAVTHRSAAAFVDAEAELFSPQLRYPLSTKDRVLASLSVAFDASCEEMWLAWRYGACLVPAPRSLVKAGADLGAFLTTQHISVVSTVPTLAALWPAETLKGVRLLILGGEACSPELATRLASHVEALWNTYGPTEATVVSCAAQLTAGDPIVRIGLPLPGWNLAVIGSDDRPVAWGETGELVISGVGMARYLDKDKDQAKFAPLPSLDWQRAYRSGDLVRAEPEGLLFIGRNDAQVKLGGRRIELGEIDAALMTLPGVSAAACTVRRSETGIQVLAGYIVRENHDSNDASDRAILRRILPAALVPLLIEIENLPVRTSGKIDRGALPWPPPAQRIESHPMGGTLGWLSEQWRRVLGVPSADPEANFFDIGGTSLAAAQLVSQLRERCPSLSIVDIYQNPILSEMAAKMDELACTRRSARIVRPTPRRAGIFQILFLLVLLTFEGLRWLVSLAVGIKLIALSGINSSWLTDFQVPWWQLLSFWLLFISLPGRVFTTAGMARLFTMGIHPGEYPRGGMTHLRLWATERYVATMNLSAISGTHWCIRYAWLLGCHTGTDSQLHALPPVTGLAAFGAGCAVEPEADIAGWWLDGDILHIGSLTIGTGARVGTRSTLMPDTVVGPYAEVLPGVCASGIIVGEDDIIDIMPESTFATQKESHWTQARATLSLLLLESLPAMAITPAVVLSFYMFNYDTSLGQVVLNMLIMAVPVTTMSIFSYALIVILLVRGLSVHLYPGVHSWHSAPAWAAWFTHRLMWDARITLFPIYASLITPTWLRLLGARIGHQVEASTVLGPPSLLQVDDGAFLADDVLFAPYELGSGQLRLGTSSVGSKSFVGNSAIVGLERIIPDCSLIGVLGTSPSPGEMYTGSSWLGRPPMSLPRRVEPATDPNLTFNPPLHLVLARAFVESWRLLPLVFSALFAQLIVTNMLILVDSVGVGYAVITSGVLLFAVGLLACAVAVAAKWLLTPSITGGEQHPLWSSFVWRNELADTFIESLAVPWLIRYIYGTPLLSLWFRAIGAKVGRGVWSDTHRLPEAELVSLGDGASVNRGCVLQTHLFHDRLMRLDTVTLETGATLGPFTISLPNTVVGSGTTVGPSSLVMRGEHVPDGTRWLGNPIGPWDDDVTEGKQWEDV